MRPAIKVGLSTASVYPLRTEAAFEYAAKLGYDGMELMVWAETVSQDIDAIERMSEKYSMPVLSVHAPCLLISQRVWGANPISKLERSVRAAEQLGADTVVVHPPFRWQRDYAKDFTEGLARMSEESDIVFAVENMYPLRAGGAEVAPYAPHWNPVQMDTPHVTLDLSHTAVSGSDAIAMAEELGGRLAHVHMADGSGLPKDEHLVPGRGTQPCAPLLRKLAADGYSGTVVLEVNTRRAATREARLADLAEALAFTRRYLSPAQPDGGQTGGTRAGGAGAEDVHVDATGRK